MKIKFNKKNLKKACGIAGAAVIIGGLTPITAYILTTAMAVKTFEDLDGLF